MVLPMCLQVDTLTALINKPNNSWLLYEPVSCLFSPAMKKHILQLPTLACAPYIPPNIYWLHFFYLFFQKCKKFDMLKFLPVPSASMTRLARSRTASLTSGGSVEGSRSRACTHSDSTEGVGAVTHTMEVSCWETTGRKREGGSRGMERETVRWAVQTRGGVER